SARFGLRRGGAGKGFRTVLAQLGRSFPAMASRLAQFSDRPSSPSRHQPAEFARFIGPEPATGVRRDGRLFPARSNTFISPQLVPSARGLVMKKPTSPKEFLKQRRPENFSDSASIATPVLDRSMFEYFLDTLTSRSEEVPFENFARELAKREICPNIIPHTGPTGGGDSKVDAETYPVADDLTLAWYTGIGREAAEERWAFAFSAKAQWRSKVQSDIGKIAKTDRGYKKAFFITSRFVKDKTRAEVEDALSKKHGLDEIGRAH